MLIFPDRPDADRPAQTMTQRGDKAVPHLEILPAALEQAPIIANLLELYAHDFSEFRNLDMGEDGRFGYPALPLYWSEPDRHPFLIRMNGELAGLVLVKKGSEVSGNGAAWDMAEFFVVRGCRRRGAGTQAAHAVWRRFPGPWEIRVMQANVSAQHFWAAAISKFVGEVIQPVPIDFHGERWALFIFESVKR
jgi:predicted acetyltransferase